MKIKELAKWLDKWYWKHDQRFTVDTFEVRTKDSCGYDICLYDPVKKESVKWLFSIGNYRDCFYLDRTNGNDIIEVFDSVRASSTPYYCQDYFFVRKWEGITDEDIFKATRYYIDKVLRLKYRIWNVYVNKQKKEKFTCPTSNKKTGKGSTKKLNQSLKSVLQKVNSIISSRKSFWKWWER